MNQEKKKHKVFVEGAISPEKIADSIAKHSTKTNIGAHDIFLGQVRSDVIHDKKVIAIEYTAQQEMSEDKFHELREDTFAKFNLTCMHIYHSLGVVKSGQICLFVFVSSEHRNDAFEACRYLVERIKKEVPIWGKEILEGEEYVWKENK